MNEIIKLYIEGDSWMFATNSRQTAELFGTNVLPTAFRASAPAETVLARIQELNPTARVELS